MNLRIDRDLPVPIGLQIRGAIEYGIACGELAPGARLPSVRELAADLGVAPMTIGQAYRELGERGLIEGRAGQGTFVAEGVGGDDGGGLMPDPRLPDLQRRLDALLDDAIAIGVKPAELAMLFSARLAERAGRLAARRIAMVGLFPEATRTYAAALADRLGGAEVVAVTIDELRRDGGAREAAAACDLAVTFANRRREVASLLPRVPAVAIRFIPSEETRRALAGLDPHDRVGVVSRLPEFLPIMKPGVQRFAPHVAAVRAVVEGAPDLDAVLGASDVVVLATGAGAVRARIPAGVRIIDYSHTPDPADVDRVVAPLIGPGAGAASELEEEDA
jgi:DNA-binding transcriptional regulator YhcF (GntR family)